MSENEKNAEQTAQNEPLINSDDNTKAAACQDFSNLSRQAVKNVEKFDYHIKRGLTNETLRRFGCGYLPPGTKAGNTKLTKWWWLFFPTGKDLKSGNARFIGDKDFRNFGGKDIFNFQALNSEIVIVVESEICAMTIYQETDAPVVALSGTTNTKKFIKHVENLDRKPRIIIVLTDNDGNYGEDGERPSKGKGAAREIIEAFNDLHIFTFDAIKFLKDCKDPNEFFLKYGSQKFKSMIELVLNRADLEYTNLEIESKNDSAQSNDQSDATPQDDSDPLLIPDEVLNDLLRLHNSDAGNAERLIKCYGKTHLLYADDQSRWLNFDGVKWNIAADSSNSSIISLILSMAKQLQSFTKKRLAECDPKIKEQLTDQKYQILQSAAKTAKALENKKKYSPALDTAKGFPLIRIPSKTLNYDPMLLNCKNGMIDLTNGKLYPHDPTKLFSLCAGVDYIAGYRSEVVHQFLASILPDPDARESLLMYLGYCLTGDVRHDKALFIHGGGRNGKGSLLGALLKLFGDFATPVRNSLFLKSRAINNGENATPELMKMEHKRLVIVDELTDKYLDEVLFKQLTSADPVSARSLHKDSTTIYPTWKIILNGNSPPRIKDANDIAIMERILMIKFEQTFTGKNQDPTLRDKLKSKEALTGWLNVLVAHELEWQKLGHLYEPPIVNNFKREYLDENDLIGEFISEYCEFGTDYQVTCKDFCKAVKDSSPEAAFMSDKTIIKMAEKIDGIAKHRVTKGNVFKGIKLIET